MHSARFDGSFVGWRNEARRLLQAGVPPHAITWTVGAAQTTADLFVDTPAPDATASKAQSIPRQLLTHLEVAACFRTDDRWALLYRILWRVSGGERSAMLAGDVDGSQLHRRIKAVSREIHHMHAFLRFREMPEAAAAAFVAWYEPAHDVLEMAVEHFARRMGNNSWLIATPDGAACWDGSEIRIASPCPPALAELARAAAQTDDELWLAYYRSTFNPARLNRECLERSLPVRFWKNLPEGQVIPALMSTARAGEQSNGQFAAVASMPGRTIAAQRARRSREGRPSSGSAAPDLPR